MMFLGAERKQGLAPEKRGFLVLLLRCRHSHLSASEALSRQATVQVMKLALLYWCNIDGTIIPVVECYLYCIPRAA